MQNVTKVYLFKPANTEFTGRAIAPST